VTYVEGHLEEALARAGETDVHVAVHGSRLVVTGAVTTEARRDAVVALVRSLAGDLEVRDQVTVLACHEPDDDGEEHLGSSGPDRGTR
jgi:osmotically-inducible protein OsmY